MPQQQPGAPVLDLENDVETLHYKMFKVLIHNDDKNDMVHVVKSLIEVFHFEVEKAVKVMVEAHTKGLALCTVEPLERAELHRDQLQSLSLTATIESAE